MDQNALLACTACAAFVLGFAVGRSARGADASAQERLRNEVDATEAFSRLAPEVQSEVDRLIVTKKPIHAIKRVREAAGLDLKGAKAVVDARARTHNA